VSLPEPISITAEAKLLEALLAGWASARGGAVKIMANPRHLWEEVREIAMQTNQAGPRMLICYKGERKKESGRLGTLARRVVRDWGLVVMRGHGFKNLMAEQSAEMPFYDALEEVRSLIITSVNLSDAEHGMVDYKGIMSLPMLAPSPSSNVFLDAFEIQFSTDNDIKTIALTSDT
jgi:hypothetical protein